MKRQFILRSLQNFESLVHFLEANWPQLSREETPIEVKCSIYQKSRTNDQLAVLWAGILQPMADQAWIGGRQYSAETWHEFMKQTHIPAMQHEEEWPGRWVKDGAVLYRFMPDGDRQFSGSTAMLTKRGMAEYITRCEAYAVSELGVKLPANPREFA